MLNLFYDKNGKILNYSETKVAPTDDDTPSGCNVLSLPNLINIFDTAYNVNVKVDVKTKQLILITD